MRDNDDVCHSNDPQSPTHQSDDTLPIVATLHALLFPCVYYFRVRGCDSSLMSSRTSSRSNPPAISSFLNSSSHHIRRFTDDEFVESQNYETTGLLERRSVLRRRTLTGVGKLMDSMEPGVSGLID